MVSIVGLGENAVGAFLPVTPQRLAEGHHPPIWSRPHSFPRWYVRARGHVTSKAFWE